MTVRILLAALLATAFAVGLTASAAGAQDAPDCAEEAYAVVAAAGDAAMAELIASWQVLDTKCVVEPDDAKAAIDSQQVVVLGGTKAVPESAVSGLSVLVRLAGADRVATAKAVLAWIDNRQQGKLATTVRIEGDGKQSIEDTKTTFTVGEDIQAGVWYFTDKSGKISAESSSYWAEYAGLQCLGPHYQHAADQWHNGMVSINDSERGNDSEPWDGKGWYLAGTGAGNYHGLRYKAPYDTAAFALNDGDTVTLRTDPDFADPVCEIARVN